VQNITTDIADITNSVALQIYPNPAKDKIKLNANFEGEKTIHFFIHNLSGKLVFQKEIETVSGKVNQQINIPSSLVSGNYLVSVTAGKKRSLIKLVVNR